MGISDGYKFPTIRNDQKPCRIGGFKYSMEAGFAIWTFQALGTKGTTSHGSTSRSTLVDKTRFIMSCSYIIENGKGQDWKRRVFLFFSLRFFVLSFLRFLLSRHGQFHLQCRAHQGRVLHRQQKEKLWQIVRCSECSVLCKTLMDLRC